MTDPLLGDDEAANGTNWDARLNDLVQVAKNYKRPLMIRIGGEFSGWWGCFADFDAKDALGNWKWYASADGSDHIAARDYRREFAPGLRSRGGDTIQAGVGRNDRSGSAARVAQGLRQIPLRGRHLGGATGVEAAMQPNPQAGHPTP